MKEHLSELYKYRALVAALVERHLHARYRGSMLGVFWSFLNPLCLMAVYTLVFQFYIRFSEVPNYTVFLFCGLLPWIWISSAVIEGSVSISGGGSLITKSMFPAHLLPAVAVLTSCVHYLLSLPLLFIFMFASGMDFHSTILALPLIIILQLVFLYGVALTLAALNVYYRDIQHLAGNLLTLLFFLCPILYPVTVIPEAFRFSIWINPAALLTTFYHGLIIDGVWPETLQITTLLGWACLSLVIGVITYNANRESFAEVL